MGAIGQPRSKSAHDAILKAALRLVAKRGFRAVSVNEIASDAGVGKMTVYRHWPNKAAVVMDSLLELIGNETAFPEAASALESLRQQLHRKLPSSAVPEVISSVPWCLKSSPPLSLRRLSVIAGSIREEKVFCSPKYSGRDLGRLFTRRLQHQHRNRSALRIALLPTATRFRSYR